MSFACVPRLELTEEDNRVISAMGCTSIYDFIRMVGWCINVGNPDIFLEWVYDNYDYEEYPEHVTEDVWRSNVAHLERLYQRVSHYLNCVLGMGWHKSISVQQIDLVRNGYLFRIASVDA